jgi:hypothetical protein
MEVEVERRGAQPKRIHALPIRKWHRVLWPLDKGVGVGVQAFKSSGSSVVTKHAGKHGGQDAEGNGR